MGVGGDGGGGQFSGYWAAVARWCCVDQCGGTEVVGGRTTGANALPSPDV